MNNAIISFKTDVTTKEKLKSAADKIGVTDSAFINMVVKQALRNNRVILDFPIEPTDELVNMIREADNDYKNDHDITHTTSLDEALLHLDTLMQKK